MCGRVFTPRLTLVNTGVLTFSYKNCTLDYCTAIFSQIVKLLRFVALLVELTANILVGKGLESSVHSSKSKLKSKVTNVGRLTQHTQTMLNLTLKRTRKLVSDIKQTHRLNTCPKTMDLISMIEEKKKDMIIL
jgi:hypothetical protein